MSLNSQFIFALDDTISFSEQFCDNSLLVLKKFVFRSFLSQAKGYKGFPVIGKLLMSLLSVLFHLEDHVSVFLNFGF